MTFPKECKKKELMYLPNDPTTRVEGGHREVMANVPDCDIVVNKFEFQFGIK